MALSRLALSRDKGSHPHGAAFGPPLLVWRPRGGQTQVGSVHKVIAKDTVEERILHLQDAKTDLADQVIGAGGVSLASLSQEELLDLLDG